MKHFYKQKLSIIYFYFSVLAHFTHFANEPNLRYDMIHDNCRENVHIMVLPVAETIEKQLMVVLRDRQKDLTDFLGSARASLPSPASTQVVRDLANVVTTLHTEEHCPYINTLTQLAEFPLI